MAIHTHFLGATIVSGQEAKAFERQLRKGRLSRSALLSAEHGLAMAQAMRADGQVSVQLQVRGNQRRMVKGGSSRS